MVAPVAPDFRHGLAVRFVQACPGAQEDRDGQAIPAEQAIPVEPVDHVAPDAPILPLPAGYDPPSPVRLDHHLVAEPVAPSFRLMMVARLLLELGLQDCRRVEAESGHHRVRDRNRNRLDFGGRPHSDSQADQVELPPR